MARKKGSRSADKKATDRDSGLGYISETRAGLYPTPAPAASVAAAEQPEQQQKDNGADKGVYDQGNDPDAQVNAKSRQEPIADKGADQTDDQITHQSKTSPLHHPARQPSGDDSHNEDDEKTLIGQVHDVCLPRGYPG